MSCCTGGKKQSNNKVFERLPEDIKYPGKLSVDGLLDLPEESSAPTADQERDFARIFLDSSRGSSSQHIFLLVKDAVSVADVGDNSGSLVPILSKNEKAGQTADAEVVEEAIEEFIGVLKDNAGEGLKRWTDAELKLVIKYISVDTSFWFCSNQGLARLFLQPKYLILLGKEGISVLCYGFVCDEKDMRVEGRTPQEKRSPWVVCLQVQLWRPGKLRYTVIHGDGVKIPDKDTNDFMRSDLSDLQKRNCNE